MDVDWQDDFHKLKDRVQYLFESEKWCDCRFLVGSNNQRIISAHKLILASASPVFERMFFGNLSEKSDPIIVPDVQPDAFYSMLEYIYSDYSTITTFDEACELCYVAKKYMLPDIVEQCTNFVLTYLNAKNACRAYEFARLFDQPRLMEKSMEIIADNAREVLADPSFVDVESSTLMTILDQPKLNIDSELDLFNALMRYATERGMFTSDDDNACKPDKPAQGDYESGSDQPSVIEVNVKSLSDHHADMNAIVEINASDILNNGSSAEARNGNDAVGDTNASDALHAKQCSEAILQQAVKKIRFLTLTPQQFAGGPALSKLLKQNEVLAIFIKISNPAIKDYPMPDSICSSCCFRHREYDTQQDSLGRMRLTKAARRRAQHRSSSDLD